MKKKIKLTADFSKFEKLDLNQLSSIQGGRTAITSGNQTASSPGDPDCNGTDCDYPAQEEQF
ncbi:MAG: hypothetical protein JNM68_06860 [Dinghuibacter sp.]|nr:hypothetical protein [Dinghuibacter sp.]